MGSCRHAEIPHDTPFVPILPLSLSHFLPPPLSSPCPSFAFCISPAVYVLALAMIAYSPLPVIPGPPDAFFLCLFF